MYVIIFDSDTRANEIWLDDHGFIETFSTYESAKITADDLVKEEGYISYSIYGKCSDERNHII